MIFKLKILWYLIQFKLTRLLYRHRWEVLRKRRFRRLLRVLSRSPYYRSLAASQAPLGDFPVVSKKVFMAHFTDINTCGIQREEAYEVALRAEDSRDFSPMIQGITIGLSSGTSGSRGIFLASTAERARWVAAVLDRVIGFSLKPRKIAFFLRANSNLYSSVQSRLLAFQFFDLLRPVPEHIQRLHTLQPDLLIAQPSMLREMAKAIERHELTFSPQKIISVAEVLTPEDQAYLQRVFQQNIHQVYQCTEGFLAATCAHGTLHFNEDFLYIEKKYIDSAEQRFHPVITDLLRTTQPVIRYELNDIVTEKKACACGSSWLAIEQIEGRSDDRLVFETTAGGEVAIFPDFFRRAIITAGPDIDEYALTQKTAQRLELYVQSAQAQDFEKAVVAIQALLETYDISGVTIQRTHDSGHQMGNKLRRIRNDRQKTD